MIHREQRPAVAEFMRRLYAMRLTTVSGGNVSLRIDGDRFAITPGGGDKSATRPEDIAIIAFDGTNLTPECHPSSEYQMHQRIYQECPHVGAIVHAHPPIASAFTATSEPIYCDLTAEAYAILGRAEVVPYALTSTLDLANLVAAAAGRGANCLLLENHGITTLGRDLLEAFNRLEVLEGAAQHTLTTRLLGTPRRLTPEQLKELDHHYRP